MDDTLNNFIKAVVALIKIRSRLRDKFFNKKIGKMIHALMGDYIKFMTADREDIIRDTSKERFIDDLDRLTDLLSDLNYLGLLKTSPLFLGANKLLLLLKLQVIKRDNMRKPNLKTGSENIKGTEIENYKNKNLNRHRPERGTKGLNPSKQKILEFIKSYPNTRTKDIINEFNALSDRTVKRSLTELMQIGLLKKKIENKAVYYSIVD